jgi:hypothetical protein
MPKSPDAKPARQPVAAIAASAARSGRSVVVELVDAAVDGGVASSATTSPADDAAAAASASSASALEEKSHALSGSSGATPTSHQPSPRRRACWFRVGVLCGLVWVC